ncbi:MAG TPA: SCO family protein [Methylocella sp.]|nr:SCO family protein [Methylocella sp.]
MTVRRALYRAILLLVVLAAAGFVEIQNPLAAEVPRAVGLPKPGTYPLDHIQKVPFGIVLEGNRFPHLLSHYTKGAITLFSFFYSACADPNGCPLAFEAFEQVRAALLTRADLRSQVRFVFLSLDPIHDQPEKLRFFEKHYAQDGNPVPWHFLTTYSYLFLNPVIRDMGEDIAFDAEASVGGGFVLNHILKVYLIDREGFVREIYSNQSLDPETILGDIETLSIEAAKTQ